MKLLQIYVPVIIQTVLILFMISCKEPVTEETGNFKIGWASADITPDGPVLIMGQRHARISEGVMDPLTVTAVAMESGSGQGSEKVIMISCDLGSITDELRDRVRSIIKESVPELNPEKIILNATHTHSGPYYNPYWFVTASRPASIIEHSILEAYGLELDAVAPYDLFQFISGRIASAAKEAWENRKPGGISYGLDHAVAGHNRLQVDMTGRSRMYGSIDHPDFSHMEGFEDHSVHLLYTWDNSRKLTGVVVNIAAPSQVSEQSWTLSADYWHEVREQIGKRLGGDVYILPQCSSAGDKSPHIMVETRAEERMQRLMFPEVESGRNSMGRRKQIAARIADAVTSVLPYVSEDIEWDPVFAHRMEVIKLSRRLILAENVAESLKESAEWKERFEKLLREAEDNSAVKEKPRWYTDITRSHSMMIYHQGVKERYELQKLEPRMPTEIHVLRIGDIAIATNRFELFLDYGIRIKGRSPAVQTFVVQLAGDGSYLPPSRTISGGGYGSFPASTIIGPEGGYELVENTLRLINEIWQTE